MKMAHIPTKAKRRASLALVLLLCQLHVSAGIIIHRGTQGLTMTGADGIYYDNTSGLTMTGADGLLGLTVNGIFTTGSDGLTMTGADGLTMTGADGVTYTGSNGYAATHVSGLTMTGADGLTMTGADGLTMTGADGTVYEANSVTIRQPNGLTMTGADTVTMTGVNGLTMTGADGLTMTGADGLTMTGADSVVLNSASQVVAVLPNGTIFHAPTNGLTMTGADGLTMTGADGVMMYGVQGLTMTGADGLAMLSAVASEQSWNVASSGLVGFDPELALYLDKLKMQSRTDDSNVNAAIIYHRAVTEADLNDLRAAGIHGGTRFQVLPLVIVTGTADQIIAVSKLPAVRAIHGNRTLQWNADNSRNLSGLTRVRPDVELTRRNGGMPLSGSGVGVAVIDTGINSSHADLSGRVIKNVKLADVQGGNPLAFTYPANIETLQNTDLAHGHGTFVSGIIAGTGVNSSGKYAGYAPGARLVGLSAGDASLFHVLAGFDYLLSRPDLDVRVVNCSFSANTLYMEHDPVNVATRMLAERGVNVVFSAGNSGPGMHTLNPYAAAPWVISVGATDGRGRLADFSSRGDFGSRNFRPTLVAPGVRVVSLRSSGANVTGTSGLAAGNDTSELLPNELPYYTTASGTSFSAPQVAGTIALMLQANPRLTPAEVRDILQRTATPLPPYFAHEVGAGMLNTHAAVREAAFPERRGGLFRSVLDRDQVEFVREPAQVINGTLMPGGIYEATLRVPEDAVLASAEIAWGPLQTTNDLGLQVFDQWGRKRAESNTLNLPGLTGRRESTSVRMPEAGNWKIRVHYTAGLGATAQEFAGVFQIVRVRYASFGDLAGMDAHTVNCLREAVRSFSMWPDAGGNFHPSRTLTRAELAAAMIAGARIPQYMASSPSYTDVGDATTMSYVESAQARPGGALFPDAPRGAAFRPEEGVTRLVAAIVLVRAAALEEEAEAAKSGGVPGITDGNLIPSAWRGHVAVARARGLVSTGEEFNPSGAFTRADLARALAVITRLHME